MWIPKSEEEIRIVVEDGHLRETLVFEAKSDLPVNEKVAKSVCAMANTQGGVIIYGIGEDENGFPTRLTPINLKGARERIHSIVGTTISEAPHITSVAFQTPENPSQGYVMVVVPASDRTPHMLILKGTNCFYGRQDTGNYRLSEPEVTRLYERRRLAQEAILPMLDAAIEGSPMQEHPGFAHLHVVARPTLRTEENLLAACLRPPRKVQVGDDSFVESGQTYQHFLNELLTLVMDKNLYPHTGGDFFLGMPWERTVDGFRTKMHDRDPENPRSQRLYLQVNYDGSLTLFSSRAADPKGGENSNVKLFRSQLVAALTTRCIALLGELYSRANYYGMVDVAVAVTDAQGSTTYNENQFMRGEFPPFGGHDYRKHRRLSATHLKDEPLKSAESLLSPLIAALSQGTENPFEIKRH